MKTCVDLLLVLTVLVQLSVTASAQKPAPSQNPATQPEAQVETGRRYLSLDGRYSVRLPGPPVSSDETIQSPSGPLVHKVSVRALAEYGIVYADYAKQVIEKLSPEDIFDRAVAGGRTADSKLLANSTSSVDGYPARVRKEVFNDGTLITTEMVLAGERLYTVVIAAPARTSSDPEATLLYEETARKFLDSFRLVTPGALDGEFQTIQRAGMILYEICLRRDLTCVRTPAQRLSGRAINLPKPAMPPAAYNLKIDGPVEVELIVDEKGYVIAAQPVNGHPLLNGAALEAARKARFTPTVIGGEPVKAIAVVIYNFRR